MAILESSFLIDILRGESVAANLLDELEQKENTLFVAAPTVMELWEGALLSKLPEREKSRIEGMLSALIILPLDGNAAKCAAEIEFNLIKNGLSIETEDIMVAGIAQVNGQAIVTRDVHYARIAGLRLIKY